MKTWLIVLTIIFIVLKLAQLGVRNYIRNDKTERVKYYFTDGGTTLGVIHSLLSIISTLVLCTNIVLLLVYIL